MSRRRLAPPVPSIDRSHILEDHSRSGVFCKVTDLPGIYRITSDVHNTRSDSRWVEMVGGPSGHRQTVSVRPDRVRPLSEREQRKHAVQSATPADDTSEEEE